MTQRAGRGVERVVTHASGRLTLLLALLSFPLAAAADGWKQVTSEDGIVVSEREAPGRNLPDFRGVGELSGSLYEVLAVLTDAPWRTEWMHRCTESRELERVGEREAIAYSRTHAPWPVSDRDVVLRSRIEVLEADRVVVARFRAVRDARLPPVDGVVRMPALEGHYHLTRLAPDRVRVEYQVSADPGGMLPGWLARRATRELPLVTLQNLRRQVARTRGQYDALLSRWGSSR